MPQAGSGSGKSLPARAARPSPAAGARDTARAGGYGQMVPLRGTARLIRYLSTAVSTHELPIM
jgi:hypothetical protein